MSAAARKVGIVAGRGAYPDILAKRLEGEGLSVVEASLAGQREPRRSRAEISASFSVGALGAMTRFFREHGADTAFFAGGIARKGLLKSLRPDLPGLLALLRGLGRGDDGVLKAAADEFARLGVAVGDPSSLISDLIAGEGPISGPTINPADERAMVEAVKYAVGAGQIFRRQAFIWFKGRVVAFEDRRGTDAMLARAPGPGAVLVKRSTPGQDLRFDRPAVGPSTIRIGRRVGLAGIALEAGKVILLEKEKIVRLSESLRLPLIGFGDHPLHGRPGFC